MIVCHLREHGEFPAQLADAIESGRAVVEGDHIVDPVDGAVLADWNEFAKRARKPLSPQGRMQKRARMEELRARAPAKLRFADFMEITYPSVDLADLGACGYAGGIIEKMWLREPAFRLKPTPTDAWEMVRGYCDAIGNEELSDSAFCDAWEAFDTGFTFGVALARHDPEHLGSRLHRWHRTSEVGDPS
jgi:hypothetical protein